MTEIAIPLRWTLGGIFGTLAAATAITSSLTRLRPSLNLREVISRVRTWWAMTIAFSVALLAGPSMSIAFFALVSLLGLREYLRLVDVTDRLTAGLAFLTIPITYGALSLGVVASAWIIPIAASAVVLPTVLALTSRSHRFSATSAQTGQAIMLTVWAPMHAVLLLVHPDVGGPAGGAGLMVFLVLCTEIGDIAQFLWGKALGRTPIAPVVSPNKTVAGVVGGAATAATVGLAVGPLLTPLPAIGAALVAASIALLGLCGDLLVSAMKRDAGVKDTGTLLPGHGGILDRIDSLILTAPAFAALMVLI